MAIYCRYLLQNYFKVFFLALFSFIALLVISRLREIAQFAALGAPPAKLALFTLYQIPYILPLAIAICAAIAALLLFQSLSTAHELTAFRALGISLGKIIAPLLNAALILSIVTFYITSEVTTSCHLKSRKMLYELTSLNPLFILQNAKIAKLKGACIQLAPTSSAQKLQDLLLAAPGKQMMLFLSKELCLEGATLKGKDLSLISIGEQGSYLENYKKSEINAQNLATLLYGKGWRLSPDHLTWRLLQARVRYLKGLGNDAKAHMNLVRIKSEKIGRFSLALLPLTFTYMGICFGISSLPRRRISSIIMVLGLAIFTLFFYLLGKEFISLVRYARIFFILPHLVVILFSSFIYFRTCRGVR